MPSLPDLENCRTVFQSGLLFTPLHLEALRDLAQAREQPEIFNRAVEFNLEMSVVGVAPAKGSGLKAENFRNVGAYNPDAGEACFMWLMHYNFVRNWGLNIYYKVQDVAINHTTTPLSLEYSDQKVNGTVVTTPYGSCNMGKKREKLPAYAAIFPTPRLRQARYGVRDTAKQGYSAAQKKYDLIVPGMLYGDFVASCKKVPQLKSRTALDWDIERGYVHVVPA